jgi:hypothetical protein
MRDEFWTSMPALQDSSLKYGPYCGFVGVILRKTNDRQKRRKADAEEMILNIGLFRRRLPAQSNL